MKITVDDVKIHTEELDEVAIVGDPVRVTIFGVDSVGAVFDKLSSHDSIKNIIVWAYNLGLDNRGKL